ncbi:hypothetical protein ElyMa_004463400 [Elysia marginata]|uniref:Uncharacterized protein n=1 Tax=Elysia marginata TaxID=1093978 RepID=A0AAV4HJL8_9GAST|nr:hypothetical protein ElyMa_004463400 [Elysia marginata]
MEKKTLAEGKRQLGGLKEHFQKILNRLVPTAFANTRKAEEDLEIYMVNIVEDVGEAIRKLKCEKARGDNEVCLKMLKAEAEEIPVFLRIILQNTWTEGKV